MQSNPPKYNTLIIGGGAAGFFAAARILERNPNTRIAILEASDKVLQKVKVSGGGRCNVTNAVFEREELPQYYPRGWKLMRKLLSTFDHQDMIQWLELKGVATYAQPDNRMFPETNKSQTIVDCLRRSALEAGCELRLSSKVTGLGKDGEYWTVKTIKGEELKADKVLLATGSSKAMFSLLSKIGVSMIDPVPSLFTFNIDDALIKGLEGIAVGRSIVKIASTKFQSNGPLLITHWGLSGPAVLKLSAWAARELHERGYNFNAAVNWTGHPPVEAGSHLMAFAQSSGKKIMSNAIPFSIPRRLWFRLLESCDLKPDKKWAELGKKQRNQLLERLTNSTFSVNGKSTFKEEFVTCGGVSLKEVDPASMEHRKLKGLFFAGEVLDIDAITGGYNFQAAWTTAAVAARGITE